MPQMEIRDRTQAGKRLCRQSAKNLNEIKAVFSIGDIGTNPCAGYAGFKGLKRRREFIDAEPSEFWPDECLASESDILAAIKFGEATKNMDGTVLIHCFAGISRSTATGAIIQSVWLGPGQEKEAFDLMEKTTLDDTPYPNGHMIALADSLLDRNGALVEALQDFLAEMQGSKGMY